MNIAVCIKSIPSLEGICSFNHITSEIEADGWFANQLDLYALILALKLKEKIQDCQVHVYSLGKNEEVLRLALSLGADMAWLLHYENNDLQAIQVAEILAEHIKKQTTPDLVLCGQSAADMAYMQTAYHIAQALNMPILNNIVEAKVESASHLIVNHLNDALNEVIKIKLPCVLGVGRNSEEIPRPTLPGMHKAKKKTIEHITLSLKASNAISIKEIDTCESTRKCKIIDGENAQEQVLALIANLKQDKVI